MATTPTNLPIPSEEPRDLKFNAGKFDEVMTSDAHYYVDRFGVKRWTIAGFQFTAEEAIRNYGYITMDSFEDGATLTLPNQVLRYEATGEYYRWDGAFPKTVAAGSTPASTGGVAMGAWVSIGDASLRSQLSSQNSGVIVDDSNIPVIQPFTGTVSRTQHDKNAELVSVKDFNAKGDGITDDSDAIHAALATGKRVLIPKGNYRISRLLYPYIDGQIVFGEGQENTSIFNNTNNEPLWCFGNPSVASGARQWCRLSDLTLDGNTAGATLWGIYSANAPLVNGSPNQAGQYEGVSSSPNNFYYGRTSFALADWTIAARGNQVENVQVINILGGFAMHVSSWDFYANKVRLWNSKQGLRNSGAANSNTFENFYISGINEVSLTEPNVAGSIPTGCQYNGFIIQQSGKGEFASIEFLKGQGSTVRSLYLEKNNEKGGTTDVFVGVASVGLDIQSIRHRVELTSTAPVLIENQGQYTVIQDVMFSSNMNTIVLNSGSDNRTSCVVGVISTVDGVTTNGLVQDTSTAKKLIRRDMVGITQTLGEYLYTAKKVGRGLEIRQGASSSQTLDLASNGAMNFILDAANASTGRVFKFSHNGSDGTDVGLVEISDSAYVYPSTANSGLLGTSSKPFATGYTQTAMTVVSDLRDKTERLPYPDALLDAWGDMDWISYKLINGVNSERHAGMIAQEVLAVMLTHQINPEEWGIVQWSQWPDEVDEITGQILTKAGDRYTLNYTEALCVEAAYNRRELTRVTQRLDKAGL